MSDKKTGKNAASAASKTMRDGRTSDDSKSAGGSALSQVKRGRTTSDSAAHSASEVLQSDDTAKKSKTAAASALSQSDGKKKK